MLPGFEEFNIVTQKDPNVTIYGVKPSQVRAGVPALLLLHGFPQTHHIWYATIQKLQTEFNIVALDLRGYGRSSTPAEVGQYAKSVMARDCVVVMETLGWEEWYVCAHDRGARVAHKMCVDHPRKIKKAIFLDICPTLAMYTSTNFDFARAYFHWFFLIQREPLPETLISQNPRRFAEMFMGGRQADGLTIFRPESFDRYVRNLRESSIVHAMCQDYRASAMLDLEEARDDLAKNKLIQCPLTVLWGSHGVIEQCFDALAEWRKVTAPDVSVEGHSVDTGHYIPEQAPDQVVQTIRRFFAV